MERSNLERSARFWIPLPVHAFVVVVLDCFPGETSGGIVTANFILVADRLLDFVVGIVIRLAVYVLSMIGQDLSNFCRQISVRFV